MPFVAALDTCVLVPAGLRDTLLRFAEADLYRPVWSDDIIGELGAALADVAHLTQSRFDRLVAEMDRHFPDARVANYRRYESALTVNTGDRHVLAAALAARANAIVTENVRHFPAKACEPVEVMTPDLFLLQRFDLSPEAGLEALRAQAQALRKPATSLDALLDRHAERLPRFVARVRLACAGGPEGGRSP